MMRIKNICYFAAWIIESLSIAALLFGCGGAAEGEARDQWLVEISTDAPIPQFGDRLLIEVLDGDGEPACGGCRRLLGIPERWPASFGIAAPEDSTRQFIARVRLYRTESAGLGGLPGSNRVIDAAGFLPVPRGNTQVSIHLGMACFGEETDLQGHRVCDPKTGELAPFTPLSAPPGDVAQPGSWPPAARSPCRQPVPQGMVCVPGGAFLMGSPRNSITTDFLNLEPLVKLSPYALDRDELTVGEYLDLAEQHGLTPPVSPVPNEQDKRYFCTYDPADAAARAMPVNCVSRDQAIAVCEAQGKRLPTEAEWEFAARNETQETRYPWGEDQEVCDKAVVARSQGALTNPLAGEDSECRETPTDLLPAGPEQGGADNDLTDLGIRNLGGNLSEWVMDRSASYSEPCWAGRLLTDPVCQSGSSGSFARRGASWASSRARASSYERGAQGDDKGSSDLGVRCAISL